MSDKITRTPVAVPFRVDSHFSSIREAVTTRFSEMSDYSVEIGVFNVSNTYGYWAFRLWEEYGAVLVMGYANQLSYWDNLGGVWTERVIQTA